MTPTAILFDWDNTLVESWAAIHESLNATLTAFDQAPWTLEEAKSRVRESMRESFPRLFGARWTEARDHFYATFRARHLDGLQPAPAAEELLAACAARRVPLAVVSNKNGALLRAEVDHLGWSSRFGAVLGAGDCVKDKPDAAPAFDALQALRVPPSTSVWLVGDTETDVDCATAAGLRPILLAGTPNVPPRPQATAAAALRDIAALLDAR